MENGDSRAHPLTADGAAGFSSNGAGRGRGDKNGKGITDSSPAILMPMDHYHGPTFHAILNVYRGKDDEATPTSDQQEIGSDEIGSDKENTLLPLESPNSPLTSLPVAPSPPSAGPPPLPPPEVPPSSHQTPAHTRLPIDDHKDEILDHIRNNRVTVIHGETGSGKSSRLPVMLVEDAIARGESRVKMFVSQPRRAATQALERRVREENKKAGATWKVGMRMGHGAREGPSNAEITFATTGYIVRLIANNPGVMNSHTHLIIDEVCFCECAMCVSQGGGLWWWCQGTGRVGLLGFYVKTLR